MEHFTVQAFPSLVKIVNTSLVDHILNRHT